MYHFLATCYDRGTTGVPLLATGYDRGTTGVPFFWLRATIGVRQVCHFLAKTFIFLNDGAPLSQYHRNTYNSC